MGFGFQMETVSLGNGLRMDCVVRLRMDCVVRLQGNQDRYQKEGVKAWWCKCKHKILLSEGGV